MCFLSFGGQPPHHQEANARGEDAKAASAASTAAIGRKHRISTHVQAPLAEATPPERLRCLKKRKSDSLPIQPAVRIAAPPEMCPGRLHPLLAAAEAQLSAPQFEAKQPPVLTNAHEVGQWRVQETTRSSGGTYKRWCSPAAKWFRALREATMAGFVSA